MCSAAIAMGAGGIWSMHFIAMAALDLPMSVRYEVLLTVLSLIVAIGATCAGFTLSFLKGESRTRLLGAGILLGLGISGMHYIGMAAMRMPASILYDVRLVILSVAIGVTASTAALWLAVYPPRGLPPIAAALAMAVAVSGMHYTGMAAATFSTEPPTAAIRTLNVTPSTLAYGVFFVAVVTLSVQLALSLSHRTLGHASSGLR